MISWIKHVDELAQFSLDYRRRAEQWLGNWWEFFRETSPDVRLTEHRFEVPFPASPPGSTSANELRPSDSRSIESGESRPGDGESRPSEPDDTGSGSTEPGDKRSSNSEGPRHTLVGSIDRIDLVAPRGDSVPRLRIVDYKSGSPKSQADVDEDLQLAVYHYAATHDPIVRELGTPDRLELHYLQDDASKDRVKVFSRTVSADLERTTVDRIDALAAAILNEQYFPDPDANCDYCAFHTLCPTKAQGRQVR